jgi:hypothetical protein
MSRPNAPAYYKHLEIMTVKGFITLSPDSSSFVLLRFSIDGEFDISGLFLSLIIPP